MPKIIEKLAYDYTELNEKAKEQANHWYYRHVDFFWGDEHISEIKSFLDVFNVSLNHYEYDEHRYSYETNLTDCKWQQNNKKDVLSRLSRYQVSYCCGEGLKQSFLAEYVKNGSIKNAIIAALDDSFKDLCSDFEHHFSDESIEDFYISNECLFDENGDFL